MRILFLILAIVFCCSSSTWAFQKQLPREFIIDTDMGTDDAIAIAYFLKRPDITVKAILIEGNGDAHCLPAYENALGLLKLLHYSNIPVACGRPTSYVGGHFFPDKFRIENDTFANQLLPRFKFFFPKMIAKDLLISMLQSSPLPIEILALGPLTTLADALEQEPTIKNKIRMIYMMGGAVYVPGNIISVDPLQNNRVAEWNIYFDPYAANLVFHSGVPITLVPLDVTNSVPLDQNFYHRIQSRRASSASEFVYQLIDKNKQQFMNSEWYFWDSMAAVIATNEKIARIQWLPLTVRLHPELLSGATVIDKKNGIPIRVALQVDSEQFKNILLAGLN